MADNMTVAIAAGGTAGHINPALALAEELRDRGDRVVFVGQERKLEGKLVPEAGFEFIPITVTGFDRSRPWTALTSLAHVHTAKRSLKAHFSKTGVPDAAIGFGAYVEVPLLGWCKDAGVPYALHEQNSVPGLANKMMAPHAARVCISVPAARASFERKGDSGHVVLTGNPVRRSVLSGDRSRGRVSLGVPEGATMLLVFGGSLGAKHLNERMASMKSELLKRPDLYIVHSTGADGYEETLSALDLSEEDSKRYRVVPYIDSMGDVLAAADLVLSRSGASSVAEIAALAVPSILVPYPYATADHQTTNARYLVDAGAAKLCPDADIDGASFERTLFELVDSADTRQSMHDAAAGLAQDKAAAVLADAVEGLRS